MASPIVRGSSLKDKSKICPHHLIHAVIKSLKHFDLSAIEAI